MLFRSYEATRDLKLKDVKIETPICETNVKMLEGEDIAIVPILRAGLGMVNKMLTSHRRRTGAAHRDHVGV